MTNTVTSGNILGKRFIKIAVVLLMLTAGIFLLRGWLFRKYVRYESTGVRNSHIATDHQLTGYIESDNEIEPASNIDQLIRISLSKTADHLNFTMDKNENDPNKLFYTKSAHCIGYASFFIAIFNHLIKKTKQTDTWVVRHRVRKIYFLGINVHKYFNSPFFKDHDFVTIENKHTGEVLAIDPAVNDYFYINYISQR